MGPVQPTSENSRISFRPLARSDFALLQKWLAAPHVAVWWNEPFDHASLEAKYGPGIDGSRLIPVNLIQCEKVPIGWIQWYRWRDFPQHAIQLGADHRSAGIDLAIGEIEMTGRGLGAAVIREFATKYIFANSDLRSIVKGGGNISKTAAGLALQTRLNSAMKNSKYPHPKDLCEYGKDGMPNAR